MAPLWESLHVLVSGQPVNPAVPHIWRYQEVMRPFLMEAGELITAREAERRVLILENPALRGKSCITQSLYAGLQLVLPGEIAPAQGVGPMVRGDRVVGHIDGLPNIEITVA